MWRTGLIGTVVAVLALPAAASAAPTFHVVLMGDSYASGEGAPGTPGDYTDNGTKRRTNEDWDPTSPLAEPERCHRSTRSGTALAIDDLRAAFPAVEVTFGNFACSGAKVQSHPGNPDGGLLEPQFGPDKDAQPGIRSVAQVTAARLHTLGRSDPAERRVDALVLGIGGNDAFFSEVVRRCANILHPFDCDSPLDAAPLLGSLLSSDDALDVITGLGARSTQGVINLGFSYLRESLDRLVTRLGPDPPAGARPDSVAPTVFLGVTPARVLLLGYPSPVFARRPVDRNAPANADYCDRAPAGDQVAELKRSEARFVDERMLRPLASTMRQFAARVGWTFVDGHFDAFIDHGICRPAGVRWLNANGDAQRTQGSEIDTGLNKVSDGIVHPNALGFRLGYKPAIFTQLLLTLVARYPDQAPQPTGVIADADPSGAPIPVDLTWGVQNNTTIADRFTYEVARWPQGADAESAEPQTRQRVAAGVTRTRIWDPSEAKGRFTARVRSCVDETRTCGAWSAPARFSSMDPFGPLNVSQRLLPNARIETRWSHDPAWDQRDRFRYRLTVVRRTSGTANEIVRLPPTATSYVDNAPGAGPVGVLVQACSWSTCTVPCPVGGVCGGQANVPRPPTVTVGTVGTAQPPPGTFAPATGAAGAAGAFALGHRSTVTQAGRLVAMELAWAHPRQWRRVKTVALRFADGERTLADVVVDENDQTVTVRSGDGSGLAEGAELGAPGRVGAGGVVVATHHATLTGTGKRGKGLRVHLPLAVAPGTVPSGTTLRVLASGSEDGGRRQRWLPAGTLTVR